MKSEFETYLQVLGVTPASLVEPIPDGAVVVVHATGEAGVVMASNTTVSPYLHYRVLLESGKTKLYLHTQLEEQ